VATSLGLCTLVAEDDILVSSLITSICWVDTSGFSSCDGLLLDVCIYCSPSGVTSCLIWHLPRLQQLLESDDVNMRIAAGETIALLFELARDIDSEFEFDEWDELCNKLNALATDCNKHRAKTDKRKQRSVFRDVLKAVEVGVFVCWVLILTLW
ncbi:Interferon- developmental regulator 1, partial [Xenoophorus captivus]